MVTEPDLILGFSSQSISLSCQDIDTKKEKQGIVHAEFFSCVLFSGFCVQAKELTYWGSQFSQQW